MVNQSLSNLAVPEYVVAPSELIPVSDHPAHMQPIPPSRMFTIRDALKKYKEKAGQDAPVYDASQGDGGESLPGVPRAILERALELQLEHGTGYDSPFGTPLFRKVASEKYWQLNPETGWDGSNIIFAQGGRDALNKAYDAMIAVGRKRQGDLLLLSRVPWISYNWGPYSVGLNVLLAPGEPENGWSYTPEGIRASVEFARQDGREIAGILITSPDNPTGRTIPVEEQIELARTALDAGIGFVLFDWIYHWVTDGAPSDINQVLLAFSPEDREKLIFLDGITKSLGASNIRSAHLVAGKAVIKHINTQASHGVIPSFFAQAVAIAAYENGFGESAKTVIEACRASRKVLRAVLEEEKLPFIMGDGYYAFIDVTHYIQAGKFTDSADLSQYLGEEYGIAVVPGVYFSPAGAMWVRFSYALPPERTQAAVKQFFVGLKSLLA